ncbi:MAG: hypothetical protein NC123_19865, partial [Butyrivibrio sp.]|nr:hypothetical protein [Butyrivibrio sp.]
MIYSSFENCLGFVQQIVPFGVIGLRNPDFLVTAGDMYYGCVYLKDTDSRIVAGPVCCISITETILNTFVKENNIPQARREATFTFLRKIPLMNNSQFLKVLEFLHFTLNREQIEIAGHFYPNHQKQIMTMAQTEVNQICSANELAPLHNTYNFEQELYCIVRQGDTAGLNKLFQQAGILQSGVLADTPLRQMKNQFIGTVTKVGMLGAIPGGMNPEQVYRLIDLYVQKMERMQSVDAIQELQYSMVMDFCQRTAACKSPEGISDELNICIAYIRNNTDKVITVADVASQIHRSETYTIRKFKKELGITVGESITNS